MSAGEGGDQKSGVRGRKGDVRHWSLVIGIVLGTSLSFGSLIPARSGGLEALAFNPAQLAYSDRPAFACRVFDIEVGFDNNAFTFAQYNRYSGAYLDARAKEDILRSVPRSGFVVRAGASAAGAEFVSRNLGVTLRTEGSGSVRIPHEVFDLALYGNRLHQTYEADDADASGQVLLRAGGSVATAVGKSFAVGVGAYYLRGLGCAELQQAEARLVTTPGAISSAGIVAYRRASGGTGSAFELGAAFWKKGWFFSASAKDIIARITWKDGIEYGRYTFELDEGNAYDIKAKNLFRHDFARGPGHQFTTTLPFRLNVGAARVISPRFTCGATVRARLMTALEQGWRASGLLEVTVLPRILLAFEPGYGMPDGPLFGVGLAGSLGPMQLRGRFEYAVGAAAAARGVRFGLGLSYVPVRQSPDLRPYRI